MRLLLLPFLLLTLLTLLAPRLAAEAIAVLRAGDVFEMRLSGMAAEFAQDFNSQYTVGQNGSVNLPLIGEIRAGGLTTEQVQIVIQNKLVAEKIFTQPTANISMVQNLRTVTIGGSVRQPGRQPWSSDLTLSSAINAAGDLTEWGDRKKVRLVREKAVQIFDLRKIEREPQLDPKLLPGDQVIVPGG